MLRMISRVLGEGHRHDVLELPPMQVLRTRIYPESWLLVDRRDARLHSHGHTVVHAAADVRYFLFHVDRRALAAFLDMKHLTQTEVERALLRQIQRGEVCLLRDNKPWPKIDPDVRIEPTPPPTEPAPVEPVVDDPRALFITRCDARLELEGPLRFSYLMRGLAGRPATLEILSEKFPGRVVHRRNLAPVDTRDGVHDGEWDGRVDGPHELEGRRLPPDYGPCTLVIRHDEVYRDDAPFTIAEPDYVVEFADIHFATDRELLLPLADDPDEYPDTPRVSPLHVIAALLEFAADHPERQLVAYGHADTAGSSDHNDTLSTERGRNVQLYLAGEREAWAVHCQQHYEIADFKRVHRWAADRWGWDTDPGPLDNEWTDKAKHARAEFRRRCDDLLGCSLAQGVKQNEADWAAIFDLYEIAVAGYLACKPEDLAGLRSALSFADPEVVGWGEPWPVIGHGHDGVAERLNRRVEVMCFEPGELPRAHGSEDPQGDELYASGRYQHVRLAPVGSDEALLRVTLLDEHGDAMPGARYTAKTRGGPWSGTADAGGVATFPRALADAEVEIHWNAADDEERRYVQFYRLVTDSGETDVGLLRRLANLGFAAETTRAVALFQRFLGLAPTGKLEDAASLINEWYTTGRRPTPDPEDYPAPEEPSPATDEDDE